ncbi:general stress protein 26 [Asticcacaulis biprosthecium C19]|uniref:General stress protein 26 n=1 Tax=Asticcacaulis biprosthecium C19 TaxID=715226 RepID=F4QJN0_9CAUL|nr:pyridoxamine 5'-phosphate oxidase family protein [Asticcacaulis biprosthecium]EGF91981.1 general stress protein 26 [Asticcacaulis biprosthecium C19]
MNTLYGDEARAKIWALIKDIKVAMMATWDGDSHESHARPMMALETDQFDGTLWFFTGKHSRKADEVRDAHEALLTYTDPKAMNYVSVSGRASLVDDRAKIDEMWTDYAKIWFPEGKEDPNLTLLRFDADTAEFWEAPNAVVRSVSYLKALVTGTTPDIGTVGRANMQH